MPVTTRSEAQGALAGLVATVAGVPMLAVALVAALVLQRTVVAKVLHQDVEFSDMRWGSTAIVANIVLAVLTGGIAALLAGMISFKVIKTAAVRGYMVVSAVGFAVIAFGVWRWLKPHASDNAGALATLIVFGWLAALAGAYTATLADEEKPAA
jgi:hypothetical protein